LLLTLGISGGGAGETPAEVFARLYEEFMPRVFRYVSYKIANRSTAEDLTSTVFEKALKSFKRYSSDRSAFSTWIFAIARNTMIDYFRVHRPSQSLDAEGAPAIPDGHESPEEHAVKSDELRRLEHCMEKLEPREREIVSLKFAGEITNRAIARQTGLSESNVAVILFRAIRKLKACVEGGGG
jgi:RNA polymerase sigma factor (sigma-70 family)